MEEFINEYIEIAKEDKEVLATLVSKATQVI